MLREIRDVRQIPGEPTRRWFVDDYFDLIVWTRPDGGFHGFQLCYDVGGHERALTWREGRGFSHDRVDDGEQAGVTAHKRTPILLADGVPDVAGLEAAFRARAGGIDERVREQVLAQLARYHAPMPEPTPPAPPPPSDDPLTRALRQLESGRLEFACRPGLYRARRLAAWLAGAAAFAFGFFALFAVPEGLSGIGRPGLLAISALFTAVTLSLHYSLPGLRERYTLTPELIRADYPDGRSLVLRWSELARLRHHRFMHRLDLCGAAPWMVLPVSTQVCGFILMRQVIEAIMARRAAAPPADAEAVQERLVAALFDPACYPHPVDEVRHRETHISHVLLTGEFAYKIKKPLDLGFLDFSTLEKRRHFCEEELRLNRRLAAEIYCGVVPISETAEGVRVGRDGAAVEYAVRMLQFDPDATLDRELARGAVGEADAAAIARMLADFHAACARGEAGRRWGAPDSVRAPALANFEALRGLLPESELPALEALERTEAAQFAALEPLMARRAAEGFVRECHGDLHLANLARHEGRILAFDCIEFSESLRWVDVMSELAFLLMDLAHHGRPDLARLLLNDYLEAGGDYAGVPLLRYYQAYRAAVRAKIAAIRAAQEDCSAGERDAALADCRGHLRLAATLAQAPAPLLAITHGVTGSGKSTATRAVIAALDCIRLRSDVERKRLFGLAAGAASGSATGGGIYTAEATARTYGRLEALARDLLAGGWPVLVDATFLARSQRDAFAALAAERGVPFVILDFRAPPDTLRQRVAARQQAGGDASEATVEVLERQLAADEPPSPQEPALRIGPDTDPATVVAALTPYLRP